MKMIMIILLLVFVAEANAYIYQYPIYIDSTQQIDEDLLIKIEKCRAIDNSSQKIKCFDDLEKQKKDKDKTKRNIIIFLIVSVLAIFGFFAYRSISKEI